jgi:LysM repeat protein
LPQFVASTPAVRSTASSGRASGSGRQGTSRTVRVERPDGPYITYTVQGGDSLWAIAKRYDVTPRDLMLWNGLTSSRIYPGDQVRIYVSP